MAHLLVVDDDRAFRLSTAALLRAEKYEVEAVGDAASAAEAVRARRFDLMLLDLRMPGLDGIGLVEALRVWGEDIPVLMVSGYGTIETAVRALHTGVDDFLAKPFEPNVLIERVQALLARRPPVASVGSTGGLVGRSAVMRTLYAQLRQVAPTNATVLITGETGTGKELVARAIHLASARASGPFVVVDCAALSETLIEAELFGHVKGSFTGAHQTRVGAIEAADGGTVFLDEIGELPIGMQPKLLRTLESSTVRRIGESKHRPVNVRFVTATHRDLLSMVNRGEFREDLYFRLAVIPVRVPALRERTEDIDLLLNHFGGGDLAWLTPKVLRALENRPWRGNVRELRNFVERARAIGPADAMNLLQDAVEEREPVTAVLPRPPDSAQMRAAAIVASPASVPPYKGPDAPSFTQPFRAFREQWIGYGERAFLRALLEQHHNNVASAAKEAGIDRTHMYRLIRKHGL